MSGPVPGAHDWIGYLQPVGLVVAPAALSRIGVWPAPQDAADTGAVAAALGDDGDSGDHNWWPLFRDILGWPAARVAGAPDGPALPDCYRFAFTEQDTLLEPDWAVLDADGNAQLLVRLEQGDLVLDRRGTLNGWEATAQQRFERLLRETGVLAGVIVGARETGRAASDTDASAATEPVLRLVVAPRGEASGHVTWPLAALATTGGRAMLAGLKLLLDAHALFTGPPSHRLPSILAESRAAQADVSAHLSKQVLASLHELLRGLDAAAPDRVRALAGNDPQHLYEGVLTVLLRLIFILYAEDRGLMPSAAGGAAASLYEQGYSLGGLHLRLRDDAALHPDTINERRGAWGRLLALFRLVDRGHPSGFMQARGGTLFDEHAFPFLLGRDTPDDAEQVLAVGDGCVLRVLDNLLMLGGERVAYRALSVEQIGAVYETVMGFTAMCAPAPMLAIRAGRNNRVPVWVDLAALAATASGEREKSLKEATGRGTFPAAVAQALRSADGVDALALALAAVADLRACPRRTPVSAGTPVLQPTDERRRTGSHYTPRALTGPIVTHALAPAFARIGADALPAAVLDLKVCDPAAGSGAFLVEACRQLGERLVTAWARWPAQRPTIPADEDELLHAKRLVAQHCLRGVDRNPLAIDLAKLSLWLETLASAHEFTFLDGVLRSGDSLVGLPNPNIVAVTWGRVSQQHGFVEAIVRDGIDAAAELRRLMRTEAEIAPYAAQERRHRAAATALTRAHLVADAVLHAFFSGTNKRDRNARLAEVQQCVLAPSDASWAQLASWQRALRAEPFGVAPFHWELEFEDVFARPDPGFDAIVGNPPFAGKNTVAAGHAAAYPDWLKALNPGAHGNADLCAHFFRRAFALLRRGGAFGLIATNTIRQGDTRETGLAQIIADGGTITRAVSRHQWEGDAAVVVAQVFVQRGALSPDATPILDDRPVRRISAYLMEGDLDASPATLRANTRRSSEGVKVYGAGFVFSDEKPFSSDNDLEAMHALLQREPAARDIIRPFLGGEEIVNEPTQGHHRYAIDFGGADLATVKAQWPETLAIVERRVKPYRDSIPDDAARRDWWLFQRRREAITKAFRANATGLAICVTSPHLSVAQIATSVTLSNTAVMIAASGLAAFATLQSRVHEVWTRFFASTLEDRLRYTPSDCFETFPLPPGYADAPTLEETGRRYHDARAALMVARNQGMTPTYNRFHRAADAGDDIVALRALHHDMDLAVFAAYGWDDLAQAAAPAFLAAEDEDDHRYQHRLFWPAPFRDIVLARLLRLNEERARAEQLQ